MDGIQKPFWQVFWAQRRETPYVYLAYRSHKPQGLKEAIDWQLKSICCVKEKRQGRELVNAECSLHNPP